MITSFSTDFQYWRSTGAVPGTSTRPVLVTSTVPALHDITVGVVAKYWRLTSGGRRSTGTQYCDGTALINVFIHFCYSYFYSTLFSKIFHLKLCFQNFLFKILFPKFFIQNFVSKIFYSKFCFQNFLFKILFPKFFIQNFVSNIFYSKFCLQNFLFTILFPKFFIHNFVSKIFYLQFFFQHFFF